MAILRSDIEKALNELKSYEEGAKFQPLAAVLLKGKWPNLIACYGKNDLGIDGYIPPLLSHDGKRTVLASSITAELEKVKKDARKIRKHFEDVSVLIFATPENVTNQSAEKWKAEIKKEFGWELIVIEREEVIASLLVPSNAPICGSFFNISTSIEPGAGEIVGEIHDAISEVLAGRLGQAPIKGKPLLPLRMIALDEAERATGEVLALDDLMATLKLGGRIILEAPAGRGKSTTLVQLADLYKRSRTMAFLIDLPVLIMSRKDIFEHIAQLPQFISRGIDVKALAKANSAEHISFLLNGWNEVSGSHAVEAQSLLQQIERTFPAAGIIVATRTHHLVPPLPGAMRTQLLSLSRMQRNEYLEKLLGKQGDRLRAQLDNDRTLDELTRTPLILARVADIYAAGKPIPTTKAGVLSAIIDLIEHQPEHCNLLQSAPLMGHARTYLSTLALQMTMRSEVVIEEKNVRPIVSSANFVLRDAGQISNLPEPQEILNALVSHHILERQDTSPDTIRFQHHQFQDFFSSLRLEQELRTLAKNLEEDEICEFTKKYINQPIWTESLQIIAEGISSKRPEDVDSIKAGKLLVEMALSVDPVFAADLARLCGDLVWKEVRASLGDCLRSLYGAADPNYRQLGLAGMFASGSDDFADIILPLLTSDDPQDRLNTYRSWEEFHLSTLGPNWESLVRTWKDEARIDFVRELTHQRWFPEIIEPFILNDPSMAVRVEGIQALSWIGSPEDVGIVMEMTGQETFENVIQHIYPESIPEIVSTRAIETYWKIYAESPDKLSRMRVLINLSKLGVNNVSQRLKTELDEFDQFKDRNLEEFIIKPSLKIITRSDPQWVSHWVAKRIADNSLWHEHWNDFVTMVPEELRDQLFQKLANENFEHQHTAGIISVLANKANSNFAEKVFLKICEVRRSISVSDGRHELEWAIVRQLKDLCRDLPSNVFVAGVLSCLNHSFDELEFTTVVDLLSNIARADRGLNTELQEDVRQKLRAYLMRGLQFVLSAEDLSGELKADYASSIAQVGGPQDIETLRDLIHADIERMRRARAARQGGTTTNARWHIDALVKLGSLRAEEVVLELLEVPEYELESSLALVRMAREQQAMDIPFFNRGSYQDIWKMREGDSLRGFNETLRMKYAIAIRGRILKLLEEYRSSDAKNEYDFRLKRLAEVQAELDPKSSSDIVIETLLLPGRHSEWTQAKALENLLLGGGKLSTNETIKIFNMILGRLGQDGYPGDQEHFLIKKLLCLLPFIDDPAEGLKNIRKVIPELKLPVYELRDVVTAIGYSRYDESLPLLIELAGPSGENLENLGESWINAVAAIDSAESRRVLLSFIDSDIQIFPVNPNIDRNDVLASRIAEIVRKDTAVEQRLFQLCGMDLEPRRRLLLSEVIGKLDTQASLLAGLDLINDKANSSVPHSIVRRIETVMVEQKPYGKTENSYTLTPRSSQATRERLFEMANGDEKRKHSAFSLLGEAEVWRLDYGKPVDEPRHPNFSSGMKWPPVKNS